MVLIYALVVFSAMVALASLSVDGGQYYLVRTQLQMATDAAARYGASGLTADWQSNPRPNTDEAIRRAMTAAADNTAGGQPVTIAATDIQCLSYDPQTKLVQSGLNGPSYAVQVTARRTLSLIFGMCNVAIQTTAIAKIDPPSTGYGLVGLDQVTINGNGHIDSYNSALGPYSAIGATSNVSVVSNGNISLNGNAQIHGDAHPGLGMSVQLSGNAQVTGSRSPLVSTLNFPNALLPAQYSEGGNFTLSGNRNFNLSAGTYYYSGFSVSGNATLNVTGPVTIYVNGNVSLAGNANVFQNLPANFQIFVIGSGTTQVSGNGALAANIYAPQGQVTFSGNGDFYGAMVGKSLQVVGNGNIHYDQSLAGQGSASGAITLVR